MGLLVAELLLFFLGVMEPEDTSSYHTAIVTLGVISMWQITPNFLYLYFSYTITDNFKKINRTFLELIPIERWLLDGNVDDWTAGDDLTTILRDIRTLHGIMADAVRLLNKCYGFYLVTDCLFLIITSVVKLYIFLYVSAKFYVMLFGEMLCGVLLIYISHEVTREVSSFNNILKVVSYK